MRVCILTPFSLSYKGGIEASTSFLVEELNRKGVETEIAFLPDSTTRYTTKSLRILISVFLYRKLMKMKGKVDIIHANSWCSWLLRFAKEKPSIAVCHGSEHEYLQLMNGDVGLIRRLYSGIVTMRLERMGYEAARHVVAVSKSSKRDVALNYNIPDEKITVIPNGIPVDKLIRARTDLKERLGCDTLIFTVGRFAKQKGFEYLVRAVPLIKEKNFMLVIAGSGPEYENLLTLVRKLKVEDRVMLTGSITEREKAEFYSSADVFVCPSLWEGFATTVLEAMAYKTPIVAAGVAGVREAVEGCGVLVEPRSPEALSRGIGKLLDDKRDAKRLAQKAYDRLTHNFTAEKMADAYIELYESLIRK